MDEKCIKVLLIEDNLADVRLMQAMLEERAALETSMQNIELDYVRRLSAGIEHLAQNDANVLLLDLSLPDSQGIETLFKINELYQDIPIIVLTGTDDEELAVRAVREGAQDYLVKGEVTGNLLIRAIRYAIERKKLERAREKLINELQDALDRIKTLEGLIPICSYCKKVRDDQGYWNQVESYIQEHTAAEFSHGICPDCMEKLYADLGIEDEPKE